MTSGFDIDVLIIDLIDELLGFLGVQLLMAGERLVTMSKALNDADGVEELNATRAHHRLLSFCLQYFGGTIPRVD